MGVKIGYRCLLVVVCLHKLREDVFSSLKLRVARLN